MITEETKGFLSTVKNNGYSLSLFEHYVIICGGIDKLKKKDLDEIFREIPTITIRSDFMDIYKLVSANESGRKMNRWTWIAVSISLVSLCVSIFSLLKK